MVPQIRKKNLFVLKMQNLRRNILRTEVITERWGMESGIELYIDKILFYLRIESKVWKQRCENWFGKDDTNTVASAAVMMALDECCVALKEIKKQFKENDIKILCMKTSGTVKKISGS